MNVYNVWNEQEQLLTSFLAAEDVYFMAIDSNLTKTIPSSSSQMDDRPQLFESAGSEITIDGRIDDLGYRYLDYDFPNPPWTFETRNYTINLGSSNDTKNMYIYATVEREPQYDYSGNTTLLLLFNEVNQDFFVKAMMPLCLVTISPAVILADTPLKICSGICAPNPYKVILIMEGVTMVWLLSLFQME